MGELRADMRPVLVLWDVDHTLIENSGVSKENYQKAFEILTGRAPEHPVETDGRTDPEIIRNMFASHGIAFPDGYVSRIDEALEGAMSSNFLRLRDRGYELPGARSALSALQKLPGVVQSVLTGNIRPNAFAKLSAFGLDAYIDFDVGGYGSDDKVRSNLVAVARERARAKYYLTFYSATTLLVGDTTRDVRAGRHGGAYVMAVASGGDTVERLQAEGADITRPGRLGQQSGRAVGDPGGAQLPAILAHPDQHTALPVQIHSHDLTPGVVFAHKGLPDWWRRVLATSSIRQKRRPASSWHQVLDVREYLDHAEALVPGTVSNSSQVGRPNGAVPTCCQSHRRSGPCCTTRLTDWMLT